MDTDRVTNSIFSREIKDKFFRYVPIRNAGECWIWNGALSDSGYGWIRVGKSALLAHRMSYIMFYDKIVGGLLVLHTCDERRCVNPSHLYLGNYSDNMYDRSRRNKISFHSINMNRSKFSYENVEEMTNLKNRGISYEHIGKIFNVTGHTISDLVNGRIKRLRS